MSGESDIAKKVTKAVKTVDKLVQDILKDVDQIREVARELKELGSREEDKRE